MTTAPDLETIRSHARESLDYGERSGDQNSDTQAYDWLLALVDEVERLRMPRATTRSDLDTLARLAVAHLDIITRDNLVNTAMFGNFSTQEAIVAACNAVPALLARIAELEAQIERLATDEADERRDAESRADAWSRA